MSLYKTLKNKFSPVVTLGKPAYFYILSYPVIVVLLAQVVPKSNAELLHGNRVISVITGIPNGNTNMKPGPNY